MSKNVGWISACCGAYCGQDEDWCWNCNRDRGDTPDAVTTNEVCSQCGEEYLGVREGEYLGVPGKEEIAMCPHYFEHNTPGVYYPPNYRPDLLAELNGYYLHDGGVAEKVDP